MKRHTLEVQFKTKFQFTRFFSSIFHHYQIACTDMPFCCCIYDCVYICFILVYLCSYLLWGYSPCMISIYNSSLGSSPGRTSYTEVLGNLPLSHHTPSKYNRVELVKCIYHNSEHSNKLSSPCTSCKQLFSQYVSYTYFIFIV